MNQYLLQQPTLFSQRNWIPTIEDNIPVEDYRELAKQFDWYNVFLSLYYQNLRRQDSSTLKILDLACGTGRWLQSYQYYIQPNVSKNIPVTINYDLLDYSENALLQAVEKISSPLQLGNKFISLVQETELVESSYDLIWSMHGFYAMSRSDLKAILEKISASVKEDGVAFIAQANRQSFYIDFYQRYLQAFRNNNEEGFTCAEDIVEVLKALGIEYQIDIVRYDEIIPVDDIARVEHYIFNEATINSFSKEEAPELESSVVNIQLQDLLEHPEMGAYLKSLIRDSAYHFPEEVWLISFGKTSQPKHPQFVKSDRQITVNKASNPLLPNSAEMNQMVATAMQFIATAQEQSDCLPLNGSGYKWLHQGNNSSEVEAAIALAQTVVEPLPEIGNPHLESILSDLFGRLATSSMNTNSGGYLGYIPSGGLFHAALADFISLSLNRYVSIFMAAPGLAAIEAQAIRWLCDIIGLPSTAGGIVTSGGSIATLTAIHAARAVKLSPLGTDAFLRGTAYVSEQAHHCLEKGLILCGFPPQNVRKIPVNRNFQMRLDLLREAINRDRAAGLHPFLVAATAGTTNTGAVDDLQAIGQLAHNYDLWFHVDAAYGGFFAMTQRGATILQGIDRADSVVLDPHKSMFLPYGTGVLLVKNQATLRSGFDATGTYLPAQNDDAPQLDDMMYLSPELSREFRGLRIWLPLKMLGLQAFRAQLEEKLDLAQWMTEQLSLVPQIRIVAQPQLSILAFKLEPAEHNLEAQALDRLNQEFLDAINRRGNILLSPFRGKADGEFCLRVAILSFRTSLHHLQQGLIDIREAVAEVFQP